MHHYYGILHKDGDGAYGIHFPDLPGCFSAADNENDIVAQASEAVALWLEGRPPVKPSDLHSISRMARADIARGGVIVLVPYPALSR